MKKTAILSMFIIGIVLSAWNAHAKLIDNTQLTGREFAQKTAGITIPFIANKGQTDDKVAFYARTFGGTVFVTKSGEIIHSLPKIDTDIQNTKNSGVAIEEKIIRDISHSPEGEGKNATRIAYFLGRESSEWKNDITAFDYVNLGEVYSGITLKLRAYGDNVEKLFFVKQGANPDEISLQLKGQESIKINDAGGLEITTPLGQISFTRPIAYQELGGERKSVRVAAIYFGKMSSIVQPNATYTQPNKKGYSIMTVTS